MQTYFALLLTLTLLLIIFTVWIIRTHFPRRSGRMYGRVYQFFKRLYKGVMWPIKCLYFVYFPNNSAFRQEIGKVQYQFKVQKNGRYRPVDHLRFMRHVRIKNIRVSAFHSPASTFSLILTYISLILTFIFYFLPQSTGILQNTGFWKTMSLVAILLLVPIPIYLRRYILNLPLEEYGSLARNHLTESDMVCSISYKIFEGCVAFERTVEWLVREELLVGKKLNDEFFPTEGRFRMTEDLSSEVHQKVREILNSKRRLYKLYLHIQSVERELQRISILIANLSKRLGVPEVAVCEHVFQFSPAQYKDHMKKFYENLHVAISLVDDCFPEDRSKSYLPHDLEDHFYDRLRSGLAVPNEFYK